MIIINNYEKMPLYRRVGNAEIYVAPNGKLKTPLPEGVARQVKRTDWFKRDLESKRISFEEAPPDSDPGKGKGEDESEGEGEGDGEGVSTEGGSGGKDPKKPSGKTPKPKVGAAGNGG